MFLVLLGASAVSARSLIIQLNDGTKMYYLISLTENPCLKFDDGTINIQSDQFTVSDVDKFYISETDNPNQIQHPESETGIRSTGQADKCLYILLDKATSDEQLSIKLFSIDGKALKSKYSIEENKVVLETSGLSKGIYILHIGNHSLKFQKK